MEKLISIIVPAYNIEGYLDKCLGSICGQKYLQMEILVVDDGSTDKTLQIAQSWAEKDRRIKVLHQENSGVSVARNLGLSYATGEYCSFVDGDDWLEPDVYSGAIEQLEESRADVLNFQYERVTPDGTKLEAYHFFCGEADLSTQDKLMRFLVEKQIPYHVGYEVWNKLYRMDIIRKYHLEFDTKISMGEDLAFQVKYLLCAKKIMCVGERYYNYCIRANSAMQGIRDINSDIHQRIAVLKSVKESAEVLCDDGDVRKDYEVLFGLGLHQILCNLTLCQLESIKLEETDYKFAGEQLKKLAYHLSKLKKYHGVKEGKTYWRFYLYYLRVFKVNMLWVTIYLSVYEAYRKVRGRSLLIEKGD